MSECEIPHKEIFLYFAKHTRDAAQKGILVHVFVESVGYRVVKFYETPECYGGFL